MTVNDLIKASQERFDERNEIISNLQNEITKLKFENYNLRCEIQSYINAKEEAIFCENQAHDRLSEAKTEITKLKANLAIAAEALNRARIAPFAYEVTTMGSSLWDPIVKETTYVDSGVNLNGERLYRKVKK